MAAILGIVLVLASLSAVSQGIAVVTYGNCPTVPTKAGFDLSQYTGTWFSYEQFDAPYQYGLTCVAAQYTSTGPTSVSVINSGNKDFYVLGKLFRTPVAIEGTASAPDAVNNPGALSVAFFGQTPGSIPNYLVLDTDYTSFSLVYTCTQVFLFKWETAWVLTRDRGVKPSNLEDLESYLRGFGVQTGNFKIIDHDNC